MVIQSRCAQCGYILNHVNDACPVCLPNFYSPGPKATQPAGPAKASVIVCDRCGYMGSILLHGCNRSDCLQRETAGPEKAEAVDRQRGMSAGNFAAYVLSTHEVDWDPDTVNLARAYQAECEASAALRTALETLRKRAKTLRKSRDLVGPAEYHDDWPKMKVWQKAMYDVGKEFDEAIRDILAAAPAQPQENDKPVGELTVREPWLDGDEP